MKIDKSLYIGLIPGCFQVWYSICGGKGRGVSRTGEKRNLFFEQNIHNSYFENDDFVVKQENKNNDFAGNTRNKNNDFC